MHSRPGGTQRNEWLCMEVWQSLELYVYDWLYVCISQSPWLRLLADMTARDSEDVSVCMWCTACGTPSGFVSYLKEAQTYWWSKVCSQEWVNVSTVVCGRAVSTRAIGCRYTARDSKVEKVCMCVHLEPLGDRWDSKCWACIIFQLKIPTEASSPFLNITNNSQQA